jgi:hypothetical protein
MGQNSRGENSDTLLYIYIFNRVQNCIHGKMQNCKAAISQGLMHAKNILYHQPPFTEFFFFCTGDWTQGFMFVLQHLNYFVYELGSC